MEARDQSPISFGDGRPRLPEPQFPGMPLSPTGHGGSRPLFPRLSRFSCLAPTRLSAIRSPFPRYSIAPVNSGLVGRDSTHPRLKETTIPARLHLSASPGRSAENQIDELDQSQSAFRQPMWPVTKKLTRQTLTLYQCLCRTAATLANIPLRQLRVRAAIPLIRRPLLLGPTRNKLTSNQCLSSATPIDTLANALSKELYIREAIDSDSLPDPFQR